MAVSDRGPVFIKSIDRSGEFKDKHYIAGVLKNAIKEIGHEKLSKSSLIMLKYFGHPVLSTLSI